jgi:hypothetical protein
LLKIDTERSRSINYFLINPEKKGKQQYTVKRNHGKLIWQEKFMRCGSISDRIFLASFRAGGDNLCNHP